MILREKVARGKVYRFIEGGLPVTVLETMADGMVKVLVNDKLTVVGKRELDIPVIDTNNYEKI